MEVRRSKVSFPVGHCSDTDEFLLLPSHWMPSRLLLGSIHQTLFLIKVVRESAHETQPNGFIQCSRSQAPLRDARS